MTAAIRTNDPNTERAGGRCGWSIRTSLSRSTGLRSSLPFLCVMTSLPRIRVHSCQTAHVSLTARGWSPITSMALAQVWFWLKIGIRDLTPSAECGLWVDGSRWQSPRTSVCLFASAHPKAIVRDRPILAVSAVAAKDRSGSNGWRPQGLVQHERRNKTRSTTRQRFSAEGQNADRGPEAHGQQGITATSPSSA
jgi:hypothetical protein